MTDELQELFDGALASMPPSTPPPISGLHARLRKRRFKRRLALVGASVAVVVLGLGIGLTGVPSQPAGAVVLRVAPGTEVSHRELSADAKVMRTRLTLFGDTQAKVSVSGNKIIVTGAPAELSEPGSPLTQSPSLLVRPVLCYSSPYVESGSTASAVPLPSDCGPYAIQKDTPTAGGSFSTPNIESDPALASIPSTTPADDLAESRRRRSPTDCSTQQHAVRPLPCGSDRVESFFCCGNSPSRPRPIRQLGDQGAAWNRRGGTVE